MKVKIKPLYSAAEVARMLHLSKMTVRRWMKRGKIPTVDVGPRKMVPISALRVPAELWESIQMAAYLNASRAA